MCGWTLCLSSEIYAYQLKVLKSLPGLRNGMKEETTFTCMIKVILCETLHGFGLQMNIIHLKMTSMMLLGDFTEVQPFL